MNFGKRTPAAESERIIARAVERGITVFDTANVYNAGESERVTGRALKKHRSKVQIATKVGLDRKGGKAEGLSRATITGALDDSLRRLGTDWVDLYYLHAPDKDTPIEETLEAMAAAHSAGKIRQLGVSNYSSWQILEMMMLAKPKEWVKPSISQVIYNVLIREIEIEHIAFAKRFGVHVTVYNPLAGGMLARDYSIQDAIPKDSRFYENRMYLGRYWNERMFEHVMAHRALASEAGLSLLEMAYGWVATRPGVDSILVGPVSVEHLDAALDACSRRLEPALMKRIDELHRAFTGTDTSYVR